MDLLGDLGRAPGLRRLHELEDRGLIHLAWELRAAGAGPRYKTLGLGSVDIAIPSRTELDRLVERLGADNREVRDDGDRVLTLDPWRNEVRLNLAV